MSGEQEKSSWSTSVAKSEHTSTVMELGKRLVCELGLEDSTDTLSRWMAHHIAELITRSEQAGGSNRALNHECYEAILQLWRHRHELPDGKRPFEEVEPVARAIASLDPESTYPRYFQRPRGRQEKEDKSPSEQWLEVAEGIDYTARILISECFKLAAPSAPDAAKLIEIANAIDGPPDAMRVVVEFVSSSSGIDEDVALNSEELERLEKRLQRLEAFTSFSDTLATHYKIRLAALSGES